MRFSEGGNTADLVTPGGYHEARSWGEGDDVFMPERPDWHQWAACKGQDQSLWFPERNASRTRIAAAKAICETCAVRTDCLTDALARDERVGIWGGLAEKDRRLVRRQRRVS